MRPVITSAGTLWGSAKLLIWEMGSEQGLGWLPGGWDPLCWDWDKWDWDHRGVRAWCKQVRCRCCTSSCRWPCAYAEGWEREMVTASCFVPGEVCHWTLPIWEVFWDEHLTFPICVPGALPIVISKLSVHGLLVCLLPKSSSVASGLYPRHIGCPLKLRVLSCWLPEVTELGPSCSPNQLL